MIAYQLACERNLSWFVSIERVWRPFLFLSQSTAHLENRYQTLWTELPPPSGWSVSRHVTQFISSFRIPWYVRTISFSKPPLSRMSEGRPTPSLICDRCQPPTSLLRQMTPPSEIQFVGLLNTAATVRTFAWWTIVPTATMWMS